VASWDLCMMGPLQVQRHNTRCVGIPDSYDVWGFSRPRGDLNERTWSTDADCDFGPMSGDSNEYRHLYGHRDLVEQQHDLVEVVALNWSGALTSKLEHNAACLRVTCAAQHLAFSCRPTGASRG